ncbi:MAG: GNAT family N-acetyltransferase [Bacillaceae bacterium]|nr:GNAT family N-acetyltransferase [Bacillaceae bacterium]
MDVKVVTNAKQRQDALDVRMKVFVEEQKVPAEEEIDEHEDTSTHFVVYDHNNAAGAGRLREYEGYGKVERICIDANYRKKGVGRLLMNAIEAEGIKQGFTKFKLYAQTHAIPFYESLGYHTSSEEFMDAGIPHVEMKKKSK